MLTRLVRRARYAGAGLAALGLAAGLAACGGSGRPVPDWHEVPYSALVGTPGDQPQVAAVAAGGPATADSATGGPATPWLLGGTVVDTAGNRRVHIWSAPSPAGPWQPADMVAVPGLDGPQETIEYLTARSPAGAGPIAFGYRLSPDEGYPRPSAWVAGDAGGRSWSEIHEDREFFGGPDIVSFGGLSEGPHGCYVAGTWTDGRGRPVISTWRTTDGRDWTHDFTEPAFEGAAGEVPFASGVADGPAGVLVAGSVETPTRSDPGRQQGALWLAADGIHWRRLAVQTEPGAKGGAIGASESGPGTTFDAVAAVPGGWLVAGTLTVAGGGTAAPRAVPAVWAVDAQGVLSRPQRLKVTAAAGSDGTAVVPTAIDVAGGRVTVAARAGGRALLWSAPLAKRGLPAPHPVAAPDAEVPQLQTVRVATGPAATVVVMTGADASVVYQSPRNP